MNNNHKLTDLDSANHTLPGYRPPSESDGIGHPGKVPGWNPDAQILAARGVESYAELNEKYQEGERIG